MFAQLKKTAKQTVIYSLGNISTKLVGFVLLPLYTQHLTTEEYGILAIFQAILQILIGVFGFNLPTAMMRWYASEKGEIERKSIIFTTIISTVVAAIALCGLLIPFSETFALKVFESAHFTRYFQILFLAVGAGIINNVPLNLIRLKEKPVYYAVLTTVKFIIIVVLNIYFIVSVNIGVEGILLSELAGNVFIILFTIPIMVRSSIVRFDMRVLIEMLKYGIPLIFSIVFSFVLTLSDRFVIKFIDGEASVGVYSLGHKIASVINMLILQSFQLGFLPIAYKKVGEPDEKRFFSKILTYYTIVLTFSALVISIFSREIIETFAQNSEYWIAYTVVPIISLGFVLKGIQYNFALSFHYAKKTKYNAYIVVSTSVLNLILNYIFVSLWGFIGAAYSMMISILLMMVLSYIYGMKVYRIPYEAKKMSKIISLGIIVYVLSLLFNDMNLFVRIVCKTVLILGFASSLFGFDILEKVEKEKLAELSNRYLLSRIKK